MVGSVIGAGSVYSTDGASWEEAGSIALGRSLPAVPRTLLQLRNLPRFRLHEPATPAPRARTLRRPPTDPN